MSSADEELSQFVYPLVKILGEDKFKVVPTLEPARFINLSAQWTAPQTIAKGFQNMYNAPSDLQQRGRMLFHFVALLDSYRQLI